MKYLYIFVLLIIINNFSNAQGEEPFWEYLYGPPGGGIKSHIVGSDGNIYISSYNGISISTNQGQTWESIILDKQISDIAFNKENKLFMLWSDNNHDVIDCSTNQGKSWNRVSDFGNIGSTFGMVFDNKDRLYVVSNWYDTCLTIQYSDDYGLNWKICNTDNINNTYNNNKYGIRHVQIAQDSILTVGGFWYEDEYIKGMICKYNEKEVHFELINTPNFVSSWHFITDDEILIGTYDNLLYTSDGGTTWETLLEQKIRSIYSVSDDEYYICANNESALYHTLDRGKTLKNLDNGLNLRTIIKVSMTKDSMLIATGSPGFFYSTDKGESWHESNKGFTSYNVWGMSFDKKGNLYAVAWLSDFFKSTDSGKSWTMQDMNGQRYSCVLATKDNTVIIGSYWYEGNMKISRDGGETWKETENRTASKQYITQISTGRIFAGGYSLHYSDDDGETWIESTAAIGSNYSLAENNRGHLLLAGTSGRIYKSTDQGITFVEVQGSQTMQQHPTESGEMIFCKNKPYGFKCFNEYLTTDNGKTWDREIYRLNINRSVRGKTLAMDSLGTIYICWGPPIRSTDGFETYEEMPTEGLYHDTFNDIEISPDGHIYIAAEYGGIYRSRDKFVSVKETPEFPNQIILEQNIPNPFEDETEISFILPEECLATLIITNSIGQVITILADGVFEKGKHTITFKTDKIQSGVYLYSLEACGEVITKQMQIIK
jgi:photosystem II stability/assembly factor-like uncharacterized protein